jgi:hypothetical protein
MSRLQRFLLIDAIWMIIMLALVVVFLGWMASCFISALILGAYVNGLITGTIIDG